MTASHSFRLRAATIVPVLAILLVLGACAPGETAANAPASTPEASTPVSPVPGWPSSMAAIGHSGLTGYNTESLNEDTLANSWATGDEPDVDSLYLRIAAENPAMKGHAVNIAEDGSDVVSLVAQAEQLTTLTPLPELVVIQSIDNDMQCDGTDAAHLPIYREGLRQVMETLSKGLPEAQIFFVSQWASVHTYDAVVFDRKPAQLAGSGPCSTVDPDTQQILPEKEAGLQALVDEYFATVADVCSQYANCSTDGGAMQDIDLASEDLTPDFNHLSVSGQAKMAAIAWKALYPDK